MQLTIFYVCLGFLQIYATNAVSQHTIGNADSLSKIDKKFAEDNDKSLIVVRGIDRIKNFTLVIPEECKSIGICETIPNYPEKQISVLIDDLIRDKLLFDLGKRLVDKIDNFQARPTEEETDGLIPLCKTKTEEIAPNAVMDEEGEWYLVINSKARVVQKLVILTCVNENQNCVKEAIFQSGYQGKCVQERVDITLLTLNQEMNKIIIKSVPVPSCCSCIVQKG